MKQYYNKMIELYSLRENKDTKFIFHTCRIKNYNQSINTLLFARKKYKYNGLYRKVSGPTAEYFA